MILLLFCFSRVWIHRWVMRVLLIYHLSLRLNRAKIEFLTRLVDKFGTHWPFSNRFLNWFFRRCLSTAHTIGHLIDICRQLCGIQRTLLLLRNIDNLLTGMVHHRYQLHLTVLNVHLLFNHTPKSLGIACREDCAVVVWYSGLLENNWPWRDRVVDWQSCVLVICFR